MSTVLPILAVSAIQAPFYPAAVWLLIAGVLLVTVGFASVRTASSHERVVVLRLGRGHRVGGPGPVLVIPGIERAVVVDVSPSRCGHLSVRAVTADGASVVVRANLCYRIVDPEASVVVTPDAVTSTVQVAQHKLQQRLVQQDLAALARGPHWWAGEVPADVDVVSRAWGVRVLDVEVTDVQLRVTPGLLRPPP